MTDFTKLSLKEIKKILDNNTELTETVYLKLLGDSRKGAKELVLKLESKRLAQLNEKNRINNILRYEKELWAKGYNFIAGVDEAGRGPLAGPVVAAAAIFPKDVFIYGVNDSKKLSTQKRKEILIEIKNKALATGIGIIEADEIDVLNIYNASLKAMSLAIKKLNVNPDFVLSDAFKVPGISFPQKPIIQGDARSLTIAAASIIAKETRDGIMGDIDQEFPQYGFSNNKGYPTKEHREALRKYGVSPYHRKTFNLLGMER